MTWKVSSASSVTSGTSLNRGASRLAGFWEGLRDSRGDVESSDPSFVRDAFSSGEELDSLGPFKESPFERVSPLRWGGVSVSRATGEPPTGECAIAAVFVSALPGGGAIEKAQ